MKELIYALEILACYFDMRPAEFWNSTYYTVNMYCQVHLAKMNDDFKREIDLQEIITDKIISADILSNKKPKLLRIRDAYKELYKKR